MASVSPAAIPNVTSLPQPRRLHVAIQRIHRGEHKARHAHVRCHIRAVRHHVRFKHHQRQPNQRRARAEHLAPGEKHQHPKQQRQQPRCQARAENHLARDRFSSVAEKKFAPIHERFALEVNFPSKFRGF